MFVHIATQHDPDVKRHCPELDGNTSGLEKLQAAFVYGVRSTMSDTAPTELSDLLPEEEINNKMLLYFNRGKQAGLDHHEVI